mgnify:FL=1
MIAVLTNNLLWTNGLGIVIASIVLFLFGMAKWKFFAYFGLFLFLFSLYFFRNPVRECLQAKNNPTILVCPADGKVVDIQKNASDLPEGYVQKVSIFLSVFDVHVNRTPITGVVKQVVYKAGKFMMAFLPKSSELNERNDIVIEDKYGRNILVRQIAGTIARKICCWTQKGQLLRSGTIYGMVKFGSRVGILLPKNVDIQVSKNQQVYGGQTVLGKFVLDSLNSVEEEKNEA